ncbi:MAG: hypothetical protein AAGE59_07040 [Cyanobacteria bacterium P01_F01_bin.86]
MTGDFGFALGFLAGDRPSRPKSMPTNNFMFHSAVYRAWRSPEPIRWLRDGCDRITQYVGCGMGAIVLPHTLVAGWVRSYYPIRCVDTRNFAYLPGGYASPPDPLWTTVMRCHPIHCGWRLCVPTRSIMDDGCALPPDPLWMAIAHPHHPITSTTPTNYSGPTTISAGC